MLPIPATQVTVVLANVIATRIVASISMLAPRRYRSIAFSVRDGVKGNLSLDAAQRRSGTITSSWYADRSGSELFLLDDGTGGYGQLMLRELERLRSA